MNNSYLYKLRALWVFGLISWIISVIYFCTTGDWLWFLTTVVVAKIIVVLANHVGMHRYFSHKSFSTTARKHKFLVWWSVLLGSGSPIMYATTHRHHHKYSDTELDLHSPLNEKGSYWKIWLGLWEMKSIIWLRNVKRVRITTDLIRDPTIRFVHEHYFKIWTGIILCSILVGSITTWKIPMFLVFCPIGWNVIGRNLFNTIAHTNGIGAYRNFDTPDESQNKTWAHWYFLGEGYHNNHHKYPNEYNQAMLAGEWDFAAWVVDTFFWVDPSDPKAYKL